MIGMCPTRCIVRRGCTLPSMAAAPRTRSALSWSGSLTPAKRVRLGEALAALAREIGLTDEDIEIIDQMRDRSPAKPRKFELGRRAPGRPAGKLTQQR